MRVVSRVACVVLIVIGRAVAASAQQAPSQGAPRITRLAESEITDEMKALQLPGGPGLNIWKLALRNVPAVKVIAPLATFYLGDATSLSVRERQILILRTLWQSKGRYFWTGHVARGKQAGGLSDDEILRIVKGPAAGWEEKESALLSASTSFLPWPTTRCTRC